MLPSRNVAPHTTANRQTDEKWTLSALLALKPHQLGTVDIALMNLLCAEGLRGSERLDMDKTLAALNEMAIRVRVETDRHMYRFQSNRAEYQNSEAYFRMVILVTVLQQDFGIRYNPERVTPVGVFESNDKFFADSRDVFMHGLTAPPGMGTCSSLPPLYVAIGRRLRYPLSLVTAKNHLFVRWQSDKERLNIEATALGMNTYDDAHYHQWPYPITADEEREDGYLKNLTPADELAVFLTIRGACLMGMGRLNESLSAYEHAALIAPDVRMHKTILSIAESDAARRRAPMQRVVGMPPDPSLWHDEPDVAWAVWNAEHRSRPEQHPGAIPIVPGFPRSQNR